MAEKITTYAPLDAQMLTQHWRTAMNTRTAIARFEKNGQKPETISVENQEGAFSFLLDGDQVCRFVKMQKDRLEILTGRGMGDIATTLLKTRLAQHQH